jgi:hypothetical protein
MSAFIVERNHILYIMAAASGRLPTPKLYGLQWCRADGHHRRWGGQGNYQDNFHIEAARIAQLLYDENVRSYCYRYKDAKAEEFADTFTEKDLENNPYFLRVFDPVQVIKSSHCLAYQSCEHPEWETSEAKRFLDSLESAAIHDLPGYDTAAWGAPEAFKMATAGAPYRQPQAALQNDARAARLRLTA